MVTFPLHSADLLLKKVNCTKEWEFWKKISSDFCLELLNSGVLFSGFSMLKELSHRFCVFT